MSRRYHIKREVNQRNVNDSNVINNVWQRSVSLGGIKFTSPVRLSKTFDFTLASARNLRSREFLSPNNVAEG